MKDKVACLLSVQTGLPQNEIINLIENPPNPALGDYAFPCFSLSKTMKKNPVEIAAQIVSNIKNSKDFEQIEARGPYINFFLNRIHLAENTIREVMKLRDKYGSLKIKEKTLIEFPSPNTNKPLHIGHARNIVLGQSISNILKFFGKEVASVNLYNDRGVHICKSMVAYEHLGNGETPEKIKQKPDHFVGDYYVKFAQEVGKNEAFEDEAQKCLVKWEAKDRKTIELWKKMNNWAYAGYKETYKKFNLKSDIQMFESEIYKEGKEIVMNGLKAGIFKKKEDGAIFADLNQYGLGEKIVLRADGTSIYITQDLYLAILKQKKYHFDSSIYVSACEQNHHFKVLFKLLELLGYPWAKNLKHLAYGMVNLESGRMKSREGSVVDADDLIEELEKLSLEELNKRYPDITEKEKQRRAKLIAMSALRYYLLKVDKIRDIVFKPEESISFEGDTGPYLLYSYARARSILRRARYLPNKKFKIKALNDSEKKLIFQINNFGETVLSALNSLSPSIIANYAFSLSQNFNEFYHSTKVIGAEDEQTKLMLVDCFSQVLKNALSLLEIKVLEKM